MRKGIKNLIIYGAVATLVATSGYAIKKNYDEKHKNEGIKFEAKEESVIDDIRIERAITYNDGSIRFLMASDTYDFNNEDYVEEYPEEIDYIEYFDEFGNKTVVDYPTPEPQKTR